jgi:hypothetical protein
MFFYFQESELFTVVYIFRARAGRENQQTKKYLGYLKEKALTLNKEKIEVVANDKSLSKYHRSGSSLVRDSFRVCPKVRNPNSVHRNASDSAGT